MYGIIAALALVGVFAIYLDAKQSRRRKARIEAISMAPLPQLPLSFQWNWWGFIPVMAIPAIPVVMFSLYWVAFGATPYALLTIFFTIMGMVPAGYYADGYLRFALKGPVVILDADGIAFAGNYLPWREVTQIDYQPHGRFPSVQFWQIGSGVRGFSNWEKFYGRTSISARFISDPDGLAGWSRRLKEASRANGG